MSVANLASGPRPIRHPPTFMKGITPTQISAKIDLLISVTLHNWPNLTIAIQHDADTASAKDKRDFLAGAISDLLSTNQVSEAEDLEDVLVQFLNDEFEMTVDDTDSSPWEAALRIMTGREKILQGDFSQVDRWYQEWVERQSNGSGAIAVQKMVDDEGQETDWNEEEEEDEDGGEDIEMGEAPQLVEKPKEKPKPEVDEDGFTKVVARRKK